MTPATVRRLVKVNFEREGETLWASLVFTESDCRSLRLENSPFHVTGVSYRDIVKAKPTDNPIVYEFEEVVARGGHSTYMILLREGEEPDSAALLAYWGLLEQKGCSYESTHEEYHTGSRLLLSVDVPPSASVFEVYEVLKRGESVGLWLFQEGYAHLPPRQP